jgi:transposase
MCAITDCETTAIAVGFDTARYGHHATFVRSDLQPAAKPLEFLESRQGYQQLEATLVRLAGQHGGVHFHFCVDAAGQYAANLLRYLHQLPYEKTISVGEPLRNKRTRHRREGHAL